MKCPSGRPHVSTVWIESCPERGLAVIDVKVIETAPVGGEASPEVDVALDGVEAAAMPQSGLREVTLWGIIKPGDSRGKGVGGLERRWKWSTNSTSS